MREGGRREGKEGGGQGVSASSSGQRLELGYERVKENAPRQALAQLAADLAREVHDVRELLDLHERVDDDRLGLAHAVDVVAGEVDEHDVLGAVLDRGRQLGGKSGVLCGREEEERRREGQFLLQLHVPHGHRRREGEKSTHLPGSCPS